MMRYALPVLATMAVLLLAVRSEEDVDHVIVLTESNFDEMLKNHERILVEYYAPWCGHCKQLEPEYKKAAQMLKDAGRKSVLAKVDATAETALANRFEVDGYPTLFYFLKGSHSKYEGPRDATGIKEWLEKREVPTVKILAESESKELLDGIEEFEKTGKYSESLPSVGFQLVGKIVKKSTRAKVFNSIVDKITFDESVTANVTGIAVNLPKSVDPKGKETGLVMLRPDFEDPDSKVLVYAGKWVEPSVDKWVRASLYPVVGKKFDTNLYSVEAAEKQDRKGSVIIVLDSPSDEDRPSVMKKVLPLAETDKKFFYLVVTKESLNPSSKKILGVTGRTPSTVVVLYGASKYHLPEGGLSAITATGAIKDFMDSVLQKKAKPQYSSAPVPKNEVDEDGVTVLVGDTFEKHVMDPTKDVFVEFYAPYCGHCKKLAPEYAKLAKEAKKLGWDSKGVVVAKMDSTENECEESIEGYPKLILYPAVKAGDKMKKKKVYQGARVFESLLDFLADNVKNEVDVVARKKKTNRQNKNKEL